MVCCGALDELIHTRVSGGGWDCESLLNEALVKEKGEYAVATILLPKDDDV